MPEVRDISLAESGRRKIEWAERNMPVVGRLEEEYSFYIWEELDEGNAAVRLVTSWATEVRTADAFIRLALE